MKLAIKDMNWVVMLQFAEMFINTAIDNLEEKTKHVRDKSTRQQIDKLTEILRHSYSLLEKRNTDLSKDLQHILNWKKQDQYADMMVALCVAIEKGANNPNGIVQLMKSVGFVTDLDLYFEKKKLGI